MKPYSLVSRDSKNEDTVINLITADKSIMIGQGYCTIIAGPCAVENRDDYIETAVFLKECGVHILRGGIFKPRTSPYSFRGLGKDGLDIMKEARLITGLPIVTEIMDVRDLDFLYSNVDILQIGSRNMQNYTLLDELGKIRKPVLLKRGLSATIEEWLLAAEYLMSGGNTKIILCERGIRTFDNSLRNTVDIGAVPLLKTLTHLPIIVDPSHATGDWQMVIPVSKAALVAGADGVMVEVHNDPPKALSDGQQSLTWKSFNNLYNQLSALAEIENKII